MQSSSKEIIADSVTTEVAKKVIEAYKEGTLSEYKISIQNHDIDMSVITPYVRDHMGRKYAAAHIFAMRELRRMFENDKDNQV